MSKKENPLEFFPHPNPSYAWVVLTVSLLYLFFRPLLLIYPSFMVPEIMEDFNISAQSMGVLLGATAYGVIIFQLPVGILIDWYGPRKIGSLGIFLSALGALIFASTDSFAIAFFGRIMIGAGGCVVVIDTFKLIANWFEPRYFAVLAGGTVGIGMIGHALGGVLMQAMKSSVGWRSTVIQLSIIGFIYSLLYLFFIHDGVLGAKYDINPKIKKFKFSAALKKFFTRRQTWIIFLFACFSMGILPAFPTLWSVTYFKLAYAVSEKQANMMHFIMHFSFCIAYPLMGYLSTRAKNRKLFIQAGALALSIFLGILFFPAPLFLTPLILFFIGIAGGTLILPFVLIHERNVPKITGTATAFVVSSIPIFGSIFIQLIGFLINPFMKGGDSPPLTQRFHLAFYLLPVSLLIAFIISFYLKDTQGRQRLFERYRK